MKDAIRTAAAPVGTEIPANMLCGTLKKYRCLSPRVKRFTGCVGVFRHKPRYVDCFMPAGSRQYGIFEAALFL